jgi:hypothetical protein
MSRYFAGRSYFDAAGHEYKITRLFFFDGGINFTNLKMPYTTVVFDYEYLRHDIDYFAVYTPIVEGICKVVEKFMCPKIPFKICFIDDGYVRQFYKWKIDRIYENERLMLLLLSTPEFSGGQLNLFYDGSLSGA